MSTGENFQTTDSVCSLDFSPTDRTVVFGTTDGTLILWGMTSRQPLLPPITGHKSIITCVSYASDGCTILSASDDQTVRRWDSFTGQAVAQTFQGHDDGVLIANFVSNTDRIVSLSRDSIALVWRAPTNEIVQKFSVKLDARSLAALSKDGQKLLAVSRKDVCIWHTDTADTLNLITWETPMVLCVEFSWDATRVVLGMADNSLRTWAIEENALEDLSLEGVEGVPLYVVWSPDGRSIASVAEDFTMRLWDVNSRKCVVDSYASKGPLIYSPDGKWIISPNDDGTPDVFDIPMRSCSSILDLPAVSRQAEGGRGAFSFGNSALDLPAAVQPSVPQHNETSGKQPLVKTGLAKKVWMGMGRRLKRLSIRGDKTSEAVAPAKFNNAVIVVPGTSSQRPRAPELRSYSSLEGNVDINDSSDECGTAPCRSSSLDDVPGCLMCSRG